VRDLSALVDLNSVTADKQSLNEFTQKVVRQLQEAAEITSLNLQKLEVDILTDDKPLADETISEVARMLSRIRDFEQVFNICEGSFVKREVSFNPRDEMTLIHKTLMYDLAKRNVSLGVEVSPTVPTVVNGLQQVFRQIATNLAFGITTGLIKTNATLMLGGSSESLTLTVKNPRTELTKKQISALVHLCHPSRTISQILDSKATDLSTKVALVIAKQIGCPLVFKNERGQHSFEMTMAVTADDTSVYSENKLGSSATGKAATPTMSSGTNCLLVNCTDFAAVVEQLGLTYDESFLQDSAISLVKRALQKQDRGESTAYKFVFVDLDDGSLLPARFMAELSKVLSESKVPADMQVFACSSKSSERLVKKCQEAKMNFVPKPVTKEKLGDMIRM